MCAGSSYDAALTALLQDPLIRLVMASDGVTDDELRALIQDVQAFLLARRVSTCTQVPTRSTCGQGLTRQRRAELPKAGHLEEIARDRTHGDA